MYYVNREQIERRLDMLPELLQALREAAEANSSLLGRYAEERALHLALEIVTDVGSYLIDGFIMRDASSYEDIVDILLDETVIDAKLHATLIELVRLRKPLVQEYFAWDRQEVEGLRGRLPEALQDFSANVLKYLEQEGV
ncbi:MULTISPECIES: DUF86 domain-containing protein [Paenibacillus]|uniref:Uncharacterized conserved protein YutE, UPF0331/DUF86 family n=1 Tax=Paenibacillus barengoltzii J12 TaxID=935846 RepID=A0ABY1LWD2_9BACL|nr:MULTISPECIES: DUF86 domain-containing protein [Paenibacillus]MDU0329697.1 DUF86 domain-containing protein [Paenibacillus sp. 3LSP]MEC2344838.1 DUF86 domain-containing protein [Paenibacillus barengoltzii]SMF18905.1 Uncharacterized conserved protein YutE, UPF0331/DUF86 family [Paenibacillus barengoltzii J12]